MMKRFIDLRGTFIFSLGALFVFIEGMPSIGYAASSTWTSAAATTNWADANWNNGVPGATTGTTTTDVATFNTAPSAAVGTNAATAIVIDSSRNISGLTFDTSAGSWFIGSTTGTALTLTGGGSIQILNTLTATAASNETINAPLQLAGSSYSFINNSAKGILTIGGAISGANAGAATVLTLDGSSTTANTLGGVIANGTSSSVSVVKTGTGSWTLNGANTYTGGTIIKAGTLTGSTFGTGTIVLGDSSGNSNATLAEAVPNVSVAQIISVASGNTGTATISFVNNTNLNANITLNSHDLTLSRGSIANGQVMKGSISGTGNVTLVNTGTNRQIELNTETINNTGTFTISTNSTSATSAYTLISSASSLGSNVTGFTINNLGTSAVFVGGTSAWGLQGDTTLTSGPLMLMGSYTALTTSQAASTSAVTTSIELQNSVVNLNGGSLIFGANGANLYSPGGYYYISNVTAAKLGGLAGSGNLALTSNYNTPASVALTLGNSNASNGSNTLNPVYSGVLSDGSVAGATVTKVGSNKQTFAGANTYTGGTTVSAGTLLVTNTTGSGVGTGAVSVASGATFGGTGSASGVVTVAAGGILLAGDGATTAGGLTLASAPVLASGAVLKFTLASTTASTLTLQSASSLASNLIFSFVDLGIVAGQTYTLITGVNAGIDTSTWTISNSGMSGTFTDTGSTITFTMAAVPEPPEWALLIGGIGVFVACVRRRATTSA